MEIKKNPPNKALTVLGASVLGILLITGVGIGGFILGRSSLDKKICEPLQRAKQYILTGSVEPPPEIIEVDFSIFWDAWKNLKDYYIFPEDLDGQEMVYGAIKGMVAASTDAYTEFLTPEETELYNSLTEGKYEGIGATLDMINGYVTIESPFDGSPAQAAGLQSGDIILYVDGEDIYGQTIWEVISKIKGDKGTTVVLGIYRPSIDDEFDVSIVRDEIKQPAMTYEGVTDGIAYIRISRFTDKSSVAWNALWSQILVEVEKDNPSGIIFDIRSNSGGYLDSVLFALQDLIPDGALLMKVQGRNGQINRNYKVSRTGKFTDVPIVVLVDSYSASASEIFAGALLQNNRAYIIGQPTYGKGSVWMPITDFVDGSSMHITIEQWVLPNGQIIDRNNPINPNEIIEITKEQDDAGEDPQLDRAYEYLKNL
ncbi:PDZ domain-containing protein [Candidatus Dojkabacteria bacterium]|nr:PDZ domain-containing protein [Candidatus Dojkabacteria bacterium]